MTPGVAAVALLLLTAANRAANADAEASIVSGLDDLGDLGDLAPPGNTTCREVLEATNEALRRRCELGSGLHAPTGAAASETTTALLRAPPFGGGPRPVNLDNRANRATSKRSSSARERRRRGWSACRRSRRASWRRAPDLAGTTGALLGTSCAVREQEYMYFPGQSARCFLYDPSTQAWSMPSLAGGGRADLVARADNVHELVPQPWPYLPHETNSSFFREEIITGGCCLANTRTQHYYSGKLCTEQLVLATGGSVESGCRGEGLAAEGSLLKPATGNSRACKSDDLDDAQSLVGGRRLQQMHGENGCNADTIHDWVDTAGAGCYDYRTYNWSEFSSPTWCGPGYRNGPFGRTSPPSAYAVDGVDANTVCCRCGDGGMFDPALVVAGDQICDSGTTLPATRDVAILDFADRYTTEVNCAWQISCGSAGPHVVMRLLDFNVRAMDYFSVHDGEDVSAPILGVQIDAGDHNETLQFVAGSAMHISLVKFLRHGVSYAPHGFRAEYWCEDTTAFSWGCMNHEATNFNPAATAEDGSCTHTGSEVMLAAIVPSPTTSTAWLDNGWIVDGDPCAIAWKGVICDQARRIKVVSFVPKQMCPQIGPQEPQKGRGTDAVFDCDSEDSRFVNDMYVLAGEIQSGIGELTDLEMLDLSGQALSGTFPSAMGNLIRLKELSIPKGFSGTLPPEMINMKNMRSLNALQHMWSGVQSGVAVTNGFLSGTLPPVFSNWPQLDWLMLWEIPISGTLPQALGDDVPDLFYMNWQGSPAGGKSCVADGACISGTFPESFAKLTKLEQWYMGNHVRMSGTFPRDMTDMVALGDWDFKGIPLLSGTFPHGLGSSPLMSRTEVYDEAYRFWENPTVCSVQFSASRVSGTLPQLFGRAQSLRSMELLQFKHLSGTLPSVLD